jgi:hypothetical protein
MKLLKRPEIVEGDNGRPILAKEKAKLDWSTVVTCGEHAPGCGSQQEIGFDDVYKHVMENAFMKQIGYRTHCLHCHGEIPVPHENTPWSPDEVPARVEWLRRYMQSLVETLHEECSPDDRSRLYKDLVRIDEIDTKHLTKLDWQ